MRTLLAAILIMTGLAFGQDAKQETVDEQIFREHPEIKVKFDEHKRNHQKLESFGVANGEKLGEKLALSRLCGEQSQELRKLLMPERNRIEEERRAKATQDYNAADLKRTKDRRIAGLEKQIDKYRNGYPPNPGKVLELEQSLSELKGEVPKPTAEEVAVENEQSVVGTWKLANKNQSSSTVVYAADHTCKRDKLKGKWEIKTGWLVTTWEDSKGETQGVKLPVTNENKVFQYSKQGDMQMWFMMTRVSKTSNVVTPRTIKGEVK